ncbi:MAG: UbiA family prenyltransferase [bacterium]
MRICDFLFVLRPVILIPAWSFYLIGAAGRPAGILRPAGVLPPLEPFACLTAILITAYLLNQIFDRESDERNRKCLFISAGVFRTRTLVLMALIFFLIASHLFHRIGVSARPALLTALLLSLLYSLPPIRLCARPFFDLLANAVGYGGIAFVIGFEAAHGSTARAAWLAVPYVFLVASTFLHTTILDVEGDRAAGKISTTVRIGVRRSVVLAAVLHALAVAAAVVTMNSSAIVITAVSFPVTVISVFNRGKAISSFVIQANTLIVTAAAAVAWPAYLAVGVPLILLSRFYHRKRFGVTYPGPGPHPDPERTA